MDGFNGWTNYLTWYYKMYLSEYIGDDELKREAKEIRDKINADEDIPKAYKLGHMMQEMGENLLDIIEEVESESILDSPLVAAIYNTAKGLINFEEIAQWYIDYCDDV